MSLDAPTLVEASCRKIPTLSPKGSQSHKAKRFCLQSVAAALGLSASLATASALFSGVKETNMRLSWLEYVAVNNPSSVCGPSLCEGHQSASYLEIEARNAERR